MSSPSINFGNGVLGSASSQVLIITNTGTAALSITQVTESSSAYPVSGFSLPLNVNAGQQTSITVAFLPTSVGSASGSISIVSNQLLGCNSPEQHNLLLCDHSSGFQRRRELFLECGERSDTVTARRRRETGAASCEW